MEMAEENTDEQVRELARLLQAGDFSQVALQAVMDCRQQQEDDTKNAGRMQTVLYMLTHYCPQTQEVTGSLRQNVESLLLSPTTRLSHVVTDDPARLRVVTFLGNVLEHAQTKLLMKSQQTVVGYVAGDWPRLERVLRQAIHCTRDTYPAFLQVALAADRLLVRCFPKEAKKFLEDMAHAAEMFGTSRDHAVLWGLTGNAMTQYEGTDWDEALGRVRDSVSKLSEAEPCVHYARMLFDLGVIHLRLGQHDEAYRYFKMARGLSPDAAHESQVVYFPIRLRCYLSLPLIFKGKLTEAKNLVEEALELCSQLTTYHPDRTTLINNLGLIYERSSDNQDLALHFYRQSLQERRGLLSVPPSDLVPLIINVGMQYSRRGKYVDAEVHLQDALEIRKQCGWLHYDTALTLKNLARVCILRQDFQKCGGLSAEVQEHPSKVHSSA
ncbi:uncharacterized protein LOC112575016 isoform X3 [Pomacea canaliculata]|uniref:uncharacterized protein LOC112575016 isoform X3 n=1 Tax=Pomacea canaliculata TaxID=400727 RepID=UPI000D73A2F4|nr:uncharacterized protein LOC112575016 isoform X3 [Pomacea canaliculata]